MEGIGRMQLMRDPDGVPFVLMTPAPREAPPRPPEGTTGLSVWDEHYGADVERSFAFYAGLAGWTKDSAMDMGEMGTYQMVAAGGRAIAGLMRAPEAMGPRWLAYFNVPSVTGAMEEAERSAVGPSSARRRCRAHVDRADPRSAGASVRDRRAEGLNRAGEGGGKGALPPGFAGQSAGLPLGLWQTGAHIGSPRQTEDEPMLGFGDKPANGAAPQATL